MSEITEEITSKRKIIDLTADSPVRLLKRGDITLVKYEIVGNQVKEVVEKIKTDTSPAFVYPCTRLSAQSPPPKYNWNDDPLHGGEAVSSGSDSCGEHHIHSESELSGDEDEYQSAYITKKFREIRKGDMLQLHEISYIVFDKSKKDPDTYCRMLGLIHLKTHKKIYIYPGKEELFNVLE